MINTYLKSLFCTAVLIFSTAAWAQDESFTRLLNESALGFTPPPNFEVNQARATQSCDKVLVHKEGAISLCLMVRPLARMEVDYEDPHSSAPNPNQIYPLLFESLKNQLSNHDASPSQEFTPEQAKALFGADWAMATAFTLKKEMVKEHADAFLVALHKHHKADAYLLFTYSQAETAKKLINESLSVLMFKE